jgi:hypothetical protein
MSIEEDASSVNLRKLVVLERVLWVLHSPVHGLKSGLGLWTTKVLSGWS